jgi:hypothetical protein
LEKKTLLNYGGRLVLILYFEEPCNVHDVFF